eukprot:1781646-Pyramimonas_sp.AAC.1
MQTGDLGTMVLLNVFQAECDVEFSEALHQSCGLDMETYPGQDEDGTVVGLQESQMRMIVTRMQSGHVGAIVIHLSGKTWLGVGPDQRRTLTEPWGIRRLPPQRRRSFSVDNSQVRSAWRLLQA